MRQQAVQERRLPGVADDRVIVLVLEVEKKDMLETRYCQRRCGQRRALNRGSDAEADVIGHAAVISGIGRVRAVDVRQRGGEGEHHGRPHGSRRDAAVPSAVGQGGRRHAVTAGRADPGSAERVPGRVGKGDRDPGGTGPAAAEVGAQAEGRVLRTASFPRWSEGSRPASAGPCRRHRRRTAGRSSRRPCARSRAGTAACRTAPPSAGRSVICQPGMVTASQPRAENAPACAPGLTSRLLPAAAWPGCARATWLLARVAVCPPAATACAAVPGAAVSAAVQQAAAIMAFAACGQRAVLRSPASRGIARSSG